MSKTRNKGSLVKASAINAQSKDRLFFVIASTQDQPSKDVQLAGFRCKGCHAQFASVDGFKPACVVCASDEVEQMDDEEVVDIESLDSEELASIECAHCKTNHFITVAAAHAFDNHMNCVQCSSGLEYDADDLSLDDEMDDDIEESAIVDELSEEDFEDEELSNLDDEFEEDEASFEMELSNDLEEIETIETEDSDDMGEDLEEEESEEDEEQANELEDDIDEELGSDDDLGEETAADDEDDSELDDLLADNIDDDIDAELDADDDDDLEADDEDEDDEAENEDGQADMEAFEEEQEELSNADEGDEDEDEETAEHEDGEEVEVRHVLVDGDDDDIELSYVGDAIVASVGLFPVSVLTQETAGVNAGVFGQDSLLRTINRVVASSEDKYKALASFGFENTKVSVKTPSLVQAKVQKGVETAAAEAKQKAETAAATLQHSMEIAAAGISKNIFNDARNPLREAMIAALAESSALRNPAKLVDRVMAAASEDFAKVVIEKAIQLASRTVESRNDLAELVGGANYRAGEIADLREDLDDGEEFISESESEEETVTARLNRGGVKPARSTAMKALRETASQKSPSIVQSILEKNGGKLFF